MPLLERIALGRFRRFALESKRVFIVFVLVFQGLGGYMLVKENLGKVSPFLNVLIVFRIMWYAILQIAYI